MTDALVAGLLIAALLACVWVSRRREKGQAEADRVRTAAEREQAAGDRMERRRRLGLDPIDDDEAQP
jgi:hypothetical protein